MFGKHLQKKELPENNRKADSSALFYKGSIVDEMQVVVANDGTSYLVTDINLLKGLNVDDSGALAEALSMRMQVRPSTGMPNLKDSEIFATIKSRFAQDRVDIDKYSEQVRKEVLENIENEDYKEAVKAYLDDVNSGKEDDKEDDKGVVEPNNVV